jgi:hypothetical protein
MFNYSIYIIVLHKFHYKLSFKTLVMLEATFSNLNRKNYHNKTSQTHKKFNREYKDDDRQLLLYKFLLINNVSVFHNHS